MKNIYLKKLILVLLFLPWMSSCNVPNNTKQGSDLAEQELGHAPDTLSFTLSEGNNIIFKAVLDKKDTLDLFFDTGGTDLVLTHRSVKDRTSLLQGKNEHYQEENYVPLEGTYALSLNTLTWDSLPIHPTRVGPDEADGHFGWNLFEDKIVELDYDKQLMIVHTSLDRNLEGFAKMDIEYINTLFCIQSKLTIGEDEYPNRYLFDTGFQRTVILDKDLRKTSNFPDTLPVIKESKLRNGAGTVFVNRVVEVDHICFENQCLDQVPVLLLSTPNPARFETHILGNELLKRFHTILDFQHDFVYLKPNSLVDLPYHDAS
ncbi:MAG: hypothetical protein AAFY71_22750 [Bacteroidota bacterium]